MAVFSSSPTIPMLSNILVAKNVHSPITEAHFEFGWVRLDCGYYKHYLDKAECHAAMPSAWLLKPCAISGTFKNATFLPPSSKSIE
ncbi:hypothetical protein CEXT_363151 [Caerostris extrusa]|uniref:Uncharacterized protein n=1 Tax=Caerostris extrusa TaxID=172846 RepID=A0AAV4XUA1_CAEEX|nr:hypothetical protein CEXT_363151 [Caerostris extrusa]